MWSFHNKHSLIIIVKDKANFKGTLAKLSTSYKHFVDRL
jgi:hypothetical protein